MLAEGARAAAHVADEVLAGVALAAVSSSTQEEWPPKVWLSENSKLLGDEGLRLAGRVEACGAAPHQRARQPVAHVAPGERDGDRAARPPEAHAHGRLAPLECRGGIGRQEAERVAHVGKTRNTMLKRLISKISATTGRSAATTILPFLALACLAASMKQRSPAEET